jgi:hypothetical protein
MACSMNRIGNELKEKNVTLTSQSWVWVVLEPCKFTSRSRRATWRSDRVARLQSDDVFLIVRYHRWVRRLRCTLRSLNCRLQRLLSCFVDLRMQRVVFTRREDGLLCVYTMPLSNRQSFNRLDYEGKSCAVVNVRKRLAIDSEKLHKAS